MIYDVHDANFAKVNKLLEALRKKKDLGAGRQLHSILIGNGLCHAVLIADHLIRMFACCGCLLEASLVFSSVSEPSVYTWQAIFSAYAHNGQSEKALGLYSKMNMEKVEPNIYVLQCILQACSNAGSSLLCTVIHHETIERAYESNVVIGTAIIDMYGRCGDLQEAHDVFSKLSAKNLVSWSAMMTANVQHDHGHNAWELFVSMQQVGIKPDRICFLSMLKACGSMKISRHGRVIHDQIVRAGIITDITIGSSLVDMYAKCGNIDDAKNVFSYLPNRDIVCWGALISGYVQGGSSVTALELYKDMQGEGIKSNEAIFPCVLDACSNMRDLEQGQLIHAEIVEGAIPMETPICTALIDMYTKCSCLQEACHVFESLKWQDVAPWGALISGYVQNGHEMAALDLYQKMQSKGLKLDPFVWSSMLKVCTNLAALSEGQVVHNQIIREGIESNVVVGSSIVDLYVKCHCLKEARLLFERMQTRTDVTWGVMLAGYVQYGDSSCAFSFYKRMLLQGVGPNEVILMYMLTACMNEGDLCYGQLIHAQLVENHLESDVVLANCVLSMYCNGGHVENAKRVFDMMPHKDSMSWSIVVEGFSLCNMNQKALQFLSSMLEKGLQPSKWAFVGGLKACSSLAYLAVAKHLHHAIVSASVESDLVIINALIDMYGNSRDVTDAHKAFDSLVQPDVVSWTLIITAYLHIDDRLSALGLYGKMQLVGVEPNQITLLCILRACQSLRALEQVQLVHHQVIDKCLELDGDLASVILNIYERHGNLEDAQNILSHLPSRDAMAWSAMVAGYVEYNGAPWTLSNTGLHQQNFSFPSILKGFRALHKQSHDQIIRSGMEFDAHIVISTLISVCSGRGNIEEAQHLFHSFSGFHPLPLGAMLAGYLQHGLDSSALLLYRNLQQWGLQPDRGMFLNIIKACGNVGALEEGKLVHHHFLHYDSGSDAIAGTALMLMYGSCGGIEEAQNVFAGLSTRDAVCWSAMRACLAQYGNMEMVVPCLEHRQRAGLDAHSTVYATIFSALDQEEMVEGALQNTAWARDHDFGVMMMNLIHAGCLQEVQDLGKSKPMVEDSAKSSRLLMACQNFGNVAVGRPCFDQAVKWEFGIAVGM